MTRSRCGRLGTLIVAISVLASSALGQILYVRQGAPPGGDGKSWTTAYQRVEQAINGALGDASIRQIWVATGVYRPAGPGGDPNATYLWPKNVSFYGGFAGTETDVSQRDPVANPTTLSGDLNGDDLPGLQHYADNSLRLVTVMNTILGTELLDGFTIEAAAFGGIYDQFRPVTIAHCAFRRCIWGGIYAEDAAVVVSDCTFTGNDLVAIFQLYGIFHVTRCVFEDNVGWQAINVNTGDLTVVDSRFARNEGAISLVGSAYYEQPVGGASLVMERCVLEDHTDTVISAHGGETEVLIDVRDTTFARSDASFGGVLNLSAGEMNGDVQATLSDCELTAGTASYGGSIMIGGGESGATVDLALTRCRFSGGSATWGGVIYAQGGSDGSVVTVTADRCAFLDNDASQGGVVFLSAPTKQVSASFNDCLMVDNSGGQVAADQRHAHASVSQCTLASPGNTDPAIRVSNYAAADATQSILWGEGTSMVEQSSFGRADVTYSCVKNGAPGVGNIDQDPRFVSYASGPAGDFRLQGGSPCVDAGRFGYKPKGKDYWGNSRFLDGDLDGDLLADMGAHELDQAQLAITGNATPGGTIVFETTGKPGLTVVVLVGLAEKESLLPGFGNVFVSFASVWRSFPWGAIPSSVPATIPGDIPPGLSLIFQEVALAGVGKTLSNPVTIVIR